MTFKIDFEKAYNHVDWIFLDEVMGKKGFGVKWTAWMQNCIRLVLIYIYMYVFIYLFIFSIFIIRRPRCKIFAMHGLRQGDLLLSFIFLLGNVLKAIEAYTLRQDVNF